MIPIRLRLTRNGERNHEEHEVHEEQLPDGTSIPDFMTFMPFMVNALGLTAASSGSGVLVRQAKPGKGESRVGQPKDGNLSMEPSG